MSSLTNTENLLKNLLNNSLQKLILLIVRRQTISFNKLVCLDHQMSAKFLCLEKSRSILMSFSNTSDFFFIHENSIRQTNQKHKQKQSIRNISLISPNCFYFFKNIYSVKATINSVEATINSVKTQNESTNNNNNQQSR